MFELGKRLRFRLLERLNLLPQLLLNLRCACLSLGDAFVRLCLYLLAFLAALLEFLLELGLLLCELLLECGELLLRLCLKR